MDSHDEVDMDRNERACRHCHEPGGDLIAPCRCTGSIQWVHRSCLDTWRSVSPNPKSFTECDVCKFRYMIIEMQTKNIFANVKFAFLVIRDMLAIFIIINALIAGLGYLGTLAKPEDQLEEYFPYIHLVKQDWSPGLKTFILIYECGVVLLLIIVGIIGSLVSCVKCYRGRKSSQHHHHQQYQDRYVGLTPSYYPYNWYCGDCYFVYCWWPNSSYSYGATNCGCCGSNVDLCGRNNNLGGCNGLGDCKGGDCGKDGASVLVIVILVIIIILILLGVVFGICFMVLITGKIIQRHVHVLNNRKKAAVMTVADLSLQKNKDFFNQDNQDYEDHLEIQVGPTSPLLMKV